MDQVVAPSPPKEKPIRTLVRDANRLRDAKEWAQAAALYEAYLENVPGRADIWVQLGNMRKELAQYDDARDAYERALEIDDTRGDTYLQLGHLAKRAGDLPAAAGYYKAAYDREPNRADALREFAWAVRSGLVRPTGAQAVAVADANVAIVFDISDLVNYFTNARLPTGIQRVQIETISSALRSERFEADVHVVAFTKRTDYWREVPKDLFLEIYELCLAEGDPSDRAWTDIIGRLNDSLTVSPDFSFPRGAALINLGTSWWLTNYFSNVRYAIRKHEIVYIPFVHDCIPVVTPEHCVDALRRDFISWLIGVFDHARFFLCNSEATLRDLKRIARDLGYPPPEVAVTTLDIRTSMPLEGEQPGADAAFLSRHRLSPAGYVLFVSTIESRKNHIALFNVWLRLVRECGIESVPQLVCVGNDGWLNHSAYAKLKSSSILQEKVTHLSRLSDEELATLYRNALFTTYPSLYEGWGLPVTESLCFGKLPIVSNVSSLPEAGGDFAVYYDPHSERDMAETLKRFIFDRELLARYEARIAADFKPKSWSDITEEIVANTAAFLHRRAAEAASVEARTPRNLADGGFPQILAGTRYTVTSNEATELRFGPNGSERFRSGRGWWWPEPWGCWSKGGEAAEITFALDVPHGEEYAIELYLRGLQGMATKVEIEIAGRQFEDHLGPDEDVGMRFPLGRLEPGLASVAVSVRSETFVDFAERTNGIDFRRAGVGVRGFIVFRESDYLTRVKLIEQMFGLKDTATLAEATAIAQGLRPRPAGRYTLPAG